MIITSVRQGYEYIEDRQDYQTGSEITYGERDILMNIRKSKDNYNKNIKLRCFNCNVYRHIAKDYRKLKKKKEIRKCYKSDKVGHLIKNCKLEQKIKNRSIQDDSDNEDKEDNC